MRIHFIGTGDAFGSGGRGQTCIRIATPSEGVLLDCGATALEGLSRAAIATNTIEAVLVSHLHGDHFDKPMKYHLSYRTLLEHRFSLNCRRLLMTHMSTDLLARLSEVELETAADGLVVDL